MSGPDVVITGYGCVSALGNNAEDMRDALVAGRSGISPLTLDRDSERLQVKIAAQVRGFDPAERLPKARLPFLDPFAQFALAACLEAVEQSGLEETDLRSHRTSVILGTGIGGVSTQDNAYHTFYGEQKKRLDPMTIPRAMPNAAASQISMELGATGPSFTVSSACASSNHAVATGLGLIRAGLADRVITGGSEACITPASLRSWEILRVLSPIPCSPFSKGRTGMVLGEGAGIVVLERADLASARGATVYARLAGVGMSSDAGDLLRPDPAGAGAAIRAALEDAGLPAEAVDYINAHGTGTVTNDIVETAAVRAEFGSHADRITMSSTKSMHGHALGGGAALELVATILAMQHGFLPPTINWKGSDPKCDIDCVPNQSRKAQTGVALSNSFAFGGLNAVLCLTHPDFS